MNSIICLCNHIIGAMPTKVDEGNFGKSNRVNSAESCNKYKFIGKSYFLTFFLPSYCLVKTLNFVVPELRYLDYILSSIDYKTNTQDVQKSEYDCISVT